MHVNRKRACSLVSDSSMLSWSELRCRGAATSMWEIPMVWRKTAYMNKGIHQGISSLSCLYNSTFIGNPDSQHHKVAVRGSVVGTLIGDNLSHICCFVPDYLIICPRALVQFLSVFILDQSNNSSYEHAMRNLTADTHYCPILIKKRLLTCVWWIPSSWVVYIRIGRIKEWGTFSLSIVYQLDNYELCKLQYTWHPWILDVKSFIVP